MHKPTFTMYTDEQRVNENGGHVRVYIHRDSPCMDQATIEVTTTDGDGNGRAEPAREGLDYTAVSRSITFDKDVVARYVRLL